MFGSNWRYTIGGDYGYIFDQTNVPGGSSLVLPTPAGNGYTFYLQVTGYLNAGRCSVSTGSYVRIYIGSNNYNNEQMLSFGTYLFTYYGTGTGGSPWGNFTPSWTMETVDSGAIRMKLDWV